MIVRLFLSGEYSLLRGIIPHMEYIDVLDAKGNPTGERKSKPDVHRDGDWHRTVHVWVVSPKGDLLLQRRSPAMETHPDTWDTSSAGHISAGEDSITSALREVEEELGLKYKPEDLTPLFTVVQQNILKEGTYINNEFNDVYVAMCDPATTALTLQVEEVSAVRWVSCAELAEMAKSGDKELVSHPAEYERLFSELRHHGVVVPNAAEIKERLGKIVFLDVAQDLSGLTDAERGALRHCVRAAEIMTDIYLAQMSSKNRELRAAFAAHTDEAGQDLSKYFELNGGPWDEFNGNEPFIPGVGVKPKAGTFYPTDLTEKEWNERLASDPAARVEFESNDTVIRRADGALAAVPYSVEYKELLGQAASELRAAAALLSAGNFKKFLDLRAAAFESNDYWESDIAWIDTDSHPFEVTIGPYEVYADGLFGIKATFEAFVALPDKEATDELQKFSAALPEFDKLLAARLGYKAKGAATPMAVVRDVYRGGEAAFGRQFSAYNLPNNRKIHEAKGSKKVFSWTMMETSFKTLGQTVAKRFLKPEALKHYQFRNRLLFVLGHELAHGIGPTGFEVALKELHSLLEEAKADMLGVALLDYFHKKGLITTDELFGCVVSEIVSFAPSWRASYTEAHSMGGLIEYNWLKHHEALRYEESDGCFVIDPEKSLAAMIRLSEEFLKVQSDADYEKAAAFVKQWAVITPEIPKMVDRLSDLPITIHLVYKI